MPAWAHTAQFALEGLTEALYYELKPLNIELRLIEQGGSRGNNFLDNIIWNTNAEIKDYDAITEKVKARFASVDKSRLDDPRLDDPQDIVNEIYALAIGKNKQFRTLIGDTGKKLIALRNSVPIEEYLERIAANFA
jgi:hypothetical protein